MSTHLNTDVVLCPLEGIDVIVNFIKSKAIFNLEAKSVSIIESTSVIERKIKRVDRAAPAHMYQNFNNSPTNFHLTDISLLNFNL